MRLFQDKFIGALSFRPIICLMLSFLNDQIEREYFHVSEFYAYNEAND